MLLHVLGFNDFVKNIINIGWFDGFRVCPRNITGRNTALFKYKNHFCFLNWKSNCISLNKEIEMLKTNFKVVVNVISDEHVKDFIEYKHKPTKFNLI